ncbi:beta-mannosidase [Nonlabens dokdonensis]|uniref:Beta-mannosidase B n=2 Tax=Nonlabens dokdonensis TaxID=328515 RepID=L7WIA9_NONDD|nr:glycoside hydrolase family 2 protein [Nonlabens dokdonensis]AGC78738.1 beta-mannosidase/precursor (Mannase) [Nonlabens dokdonensis DSW-6]PZX39136.1 beta-mannosidase [Nonlabens dokdonensis]
MRISLFIVLAILISSCQEERPNVERQYLESNWSLHKSADYSLISDSVQIPSTVHKELLPFIKHPFQGNNEDSLQWITEENWIYETVFTVDKEILAKEHISLNFEGIDTYASIKLNGHEILETDNAFLSWQVDVKAFLEEENELYVTIKSPLEIENQKAATNPYTLPEGNRVYTRKAQYQYGWDWGPKLNTMGIWKPVYLEAYDDFKIEDVYIKQNFVKDSTANLTAQIKLSDKRTELLHYKIKVNDSLYWEQDYQPKAQEDEFEIHFEIPQMQLWWPHNIGEPYLYDIEVLVSKEGKLIDSQKLKTGIRTIKLVNEPDEHGESFYFKVNDVTVYMKGANYIPQNSMQDLVTDDHYEKLLSDVKEANMNMLRVWGGGIYENDIFYEKCDEKGILVWQDFMFACAMYPGDARFRESVTNEIKQQITRLRNHSSIALWCGNNETSEAWHNWGWQEGRSQAERDSIWEDYRAIFQIAMPKYVSELTKEPYWESSPEYGRGNPRYEFEGDAHDWHVWHDAYPFEHFEKHVPRFMSEFGFQSHPSYEAIRYINEDGTINIQSDDYASHQKHARGNELIREYMERDFPVPTNDEDYVYVSQLLQAHGISKGIQAHRRARPYNMGTLYWQLNDCWPAVSWSSIDHFGNWKALHYQVKRDFENVLISNVVENDVLKTYIVNDNHETVVADFKIEIIDFKGNVIYRDMLDSSVAYIKPNYSEVIHSFKLKDLVFNRSDVYIKTTYGTHEKISFFEKPKELNLPKAEVVMKSPKTKNGYKITLKSDVFTKDVFLYSNVKGHFSDNFFNLEPNVEKTLYFETNSEEGAVLHMKSLNEMNCKYGPIEDTEYCY